MTEQAMKEYLADTHDIMIGVKMLSGAKNESYQV